MNSNAFSAADMTTAAANGHRDGYQAGYADAVKAYETGKSAAAQEAVAWSKTKPTAEGAYYVRGFNLFQLAQYEALVQVRMHHFDGEPAPELVCNIHESTSNAEIDDWSPMVDMSDDFEWFGPLYTAPVAAAPGIDLTALCEMLEGWKNSDYPFSYEGQCAQKALNACIADLEGLLIDASPKGVSDATAFYDASAKGFHISETCGPDGKYHAVSKFQTLADLHAFEDARRTLLIAERDRRELQATSAEVGAWPLGNIDGCTESNCKRCRTHPNHRGEMEHAGIGWRPGQPTSHGAGVSE